MIIRVDELIQCIAKALDVIEGESFGASTKHGHRVGVLSAAMGTHMGMSGGELIGLTTCAMLHDNALTEYIRSERRRTVHNLRMHCVYGQRNIDTLPLGTDIAGYILYHHEQADGNGPFRKKVGETPLGAQIIGIADYIDVTYHLQRILPHELADFRKIADVQVKERFSEQIINALWHVLTEEMLVQLSDEHISDTVSRIIPVWESDIEGSCIIRLAKLIARIIDYKSIYTCRHTVQIANRIALMSEYYGLDSETKAQLYLAAALHDIGKLYIPSDILDKPGKLEKDEYAVIMKHVLYTYELLKDIKGLENVCRWASDHHEKLDGTGYPFGKTADRLDFFSRLMACIDIYQAVSEERPYHPRRSHEETMPILCDMAEHNKIDAQIVKDIDFVMAPYSNMDVPNISELGAIA